MSIQQAVLNQARSRIGYYAPDDPNPGSEAGRYCAAKTGQAWMAGPSVSIWWCMMFVSMCLDLAGQAAAIGGISQNTDVTLGRVRRGLGGRLIPVRDAAPGDVVIFDWGGDGPTDHVGFVEKNLGGGWLQTIEGNTSGSDGPRQSDGNGVWRRYRHDAIAAVIRPSYTGASVPAPAPAPSAAITVDGLGGFITTRKLQWSLGTPVDGEISGQCSGDAEHWGNLLTLEIADDMTGSQCGVALQRALGVKADGLLGEGTCRALQKALGVTVDGSFGPASMRALQTRLNTITTAGGLTLR